MIRYAASRVALACALATTVAASPAFAQSADGAPDHQTEGDDIVVTGRAGTTDQKKVDTSYAISTVSSQELQMRSPLGVVEALKQVYQLDRAKVVFQDVTINYAAAALASGKVHALLAVAPVTEKYLAKVRQFFQRKDAKEPRRS